MIRRHLLALASAALLAPLGAAGAQYPGLTLSFIDPVGTGSTTDAFEVWLRLSLDPGAAPLTFDGSLPPDFGLPAGFVQIGAVDTIDDAMTTTGYGCSGTFRTGCGPGAYEFTFHTSNVDPARPSFNFRPAFTLAPGSSFDYLFGTFTPTGGSAAPGTYRFYRSSALLWVSGTDAAGAPASMTTQLADTCDDGDDACAFTRTVTRAAVVPEPGSVVLLASGLVGVGWAAMRRRRQSA